MGSNVWERRARRGVVAALSLAVVAVAWDGAGGRLQAAPINPQVFKTKFDNSRKGAEVVAKVRVLAAVCTAAGKGNDRAVTLQLSLQVLDVDKGKVKKNDVLVVSHQVTPPAGPGPRAYGYMAALRQFPFTPGAQGSVALNWDKENHRYSAVAGWVPEPNNTPIPTEVGKAYVAGDKGKALR
jgi:hypothetical protein